MAKTPARQLDTQLEARIEEVRGIFLTAKGEAQRKAAWECMRALIGQRSPWRIVQMERERGLR